MKEIVLKIPISEEIREIIQQELKKGFEKYFQSRQTAPDQKIQYLSRKETAKSLHITLPTLRTWTKLGKIRAYKIEGRVYYKPEEIDSSLVEQPKSVRK
jgi:excisionase family DNA binding protein